MSIIEGGEDWSETKRQKDPDVGRDLAFHPLTSPVWPKEDKHIFWVMVFIAII